MNPDLLPDDMATKEWHVAEECAELTIELMFIVKVLSKAQRFGWDNVRFDKSNEKRFRLALARVESEFADVVKMFGRVIEELDKASKKQKKKKKKK